MNLKDLLKDKRPVILKRWLDLVFDDYPPDTTRFLRREKDRFANPVGFVIRKGLEGLMEGLLTDRAPGSISRSLEELIKLRAVQDFSPSEALSFLPRLKGLIRGLLPDIYGVKGISEELIALEWRIDQILMKSFDIYMRCRERVYQIRLDELKRRTSSPLEGSRLEGR